MDVIDAEKQIKAINTKVSKNELEIDNGVKELKTIGDKLKDEQQNARVSDTEISRLGKDEANELKALEAVKSKFDQLDNSQER